MGFFTTSMRDDVWSRLRSIGRRLQREFDPVAEQTLPEDLTQLLRRIDDAGRPNTLSKSQTQHPRISTTSMTAALAITATLIASLFCYDLLTYVMSGPKSALAVAFAAGLTATLAGAAWLVEGE